MKILSITLLLTTLSTFAAHLEPVNIHYFDFINWSLVTQVFPLNNGGYVVQKYGRFITLFDSKGKLVKEVEAGVMSPLYQKGTQLKDGRLIFINDQSLASLYDEQLNLLEEFTLPASYVWAPCETENGKMIFPTFRDGKVLIKNSSSFSSVTGVGSRMRSVSCLTNNRFILNSLEGLMSVVDVSSDEPKILFQKNFNAFENSFKVVNGNAHFMSSEGLVILNLQDFSTEVYPTPELEEFSGIDYFSNGNYVTIEAIRNSEGKYYSQINLYEKSGKKLSSDIQKNTGASAEMPITVVKDQFIITDHCSSDVVLYDQNLVELDRQKTNVWLCSQAIQLTNGFAFYGFDESHYVYHFNLVAK